MDVIFGLAYTAAVLLEWEKVGSETITLSPHVLAQKLEPSTIGLIRAACKAFSEYGSKKSGVY